MCSHHFYKQQGVTLIVALVMLLVLAMVGVTINKDATIQERMSSNNQQRSVARLNAHSALIAAEEYLDTLAIESEPDAIAKFDAVDGLYIPLLRPLKGTAIAASEPDKDMTKPGNWSDDNSIAVSTTVSGYTQSRFFIEYIGYLVGERVYVASLDTEEKNRKDKLALAFRITAVGYGGLNDNAAILQSIYSTQQGSL